LKKYEAVYIIDTRKVEDDGKALATELVSLIEELGGEVIENVFMGRKQFAREIEKRKAGAYYNFVFTAEPASIKTITDKYSLDERVIREMIINYDRPEVVKSKLKDEAGKSAE
jgi:small subunit ribosomal protein S6